MCCNYQIHDELKTMEESTCHFCGQLLEEGDKADEPCCGKKDIETVDGMNVCVNCGSVHCFDYVAEYVDFFGNIQKIRRKSIYHRKYHIENVLNSISCENNFQLTFGQREQIYKVFAAIDSVLHEVNDGRKRMISIKFVIKQLFKMLGLPYKGIQVTKSKRTLKYYKQYWTLVESLKGDRIKEIISE